VARVPRAQTFRRAGVGGVAALLAGCSGRQSALHPAGFESTEVAQLFWVMAIGSALVWLLVVGFALYATRTSARRHDPRIGRNLIIGGGVIVPTVVLGALLVYGLQMMPKLRERAAEGMRLEVSGEQWWWRVRYVDPGSGLAPVELANEVRLPVGRRTEVLLASPDVIHSFWIPSLAGKVDMIPGRINRLVLEPTRIGVFRGACAEYCGASHAHMEFEAVVMAPDAFAAWLAAQRAPAAVPASAAQRRGLASFTRNGCGGCHTVRGTPANGPVGPDLTHVGSRLTLAAGRLSNEQAEFRRWIARTHRLKPEALMPAFDMLPPDELDDLATYMESLQ
jgi:cytochrome c oxidase subunit 2